MRTQLFHSGYLIDVVYQTIVIVHKVNHNYLMYSSYQNRNFALNFPDVDPQTLT